MDSLFLLHRKGCKGEETRRRTAEKIKIDSTISGEPVKRHVHAGCLYNTFDNYVFGKERVNGV